MESTREGTGIMHRIEELLTVGKSSGELIDMGYAPGTVYKVQRRYRQAKNSIHGADDSWEAQFDKDYYENIDVNVLLEELSKNQREIDSLKSEISRLVHVAEENGNLKARVSAADHEIKSIREVSETKISDLNYNLDHAQKQLNKEKTENDELKRYLRSKNCGWIREFEEWKRNHLGHHNIVCSSISHYS